MTMKIINVTGDIIDVANLLLIICFYLFRYFVLFKLPNLTFLDSRGVAETERKEAKRVGKFMKVVRPSDEEVGNNSNLIIS